jgi:hypothetical protein
VGTDAIDERVFRLEILDQPLECLRQDADLVA